MSVLEFCGNWQGEGRPDPGLRRDDGVLSQALDAAHQGPKKVMSLDVRAQAAARNVKILQQAHSFAIDQEHSDLDEGILVAAINAAKEMWAILP